MGTLNFTVGNYGGQGKSIGSTPIMSNGYRTSDAYTTGLTATYVEDGSGDIVLAYGEVIRLYASEDMWVRFGDAVATVGDGFFIPAATLVEFECDVSGKVSAIDVA